MPKIALNARFYAHRPTGMQRYAIELANRLNGDLDVIRPGRPLKGARGHLWEQLYLPAVCQGKLLWSPNNTGPIAIRRQVCTIHDLIPLDHPEWFNPRFAQWYKWLFPRLAPRLQHIIAISEFTKQRVVELLHVDPRRITVVPNGVDPQFTPSDELEIAAMRKQLRIPTSHYLLSVSSLEPRKNILRLFEAWERVVKRVPEDIHLVVAGAHGAAGVFCGVKLDRLPPRVHFTGYVPQDQLPVLYSGALAFVYPSLYEGFGLPPLEAMACGTAVVTSNGTSLREVVGDAAVLIDPLNVDSIADGILRIAGDSGLRQSLVQAGRKRARHLTWDHCAQLTRHVLLAQSKETL